LCFTSPNVQSSTFGFCHSTRMEDQSQKSNTPSWDTQKRRLRKDAQFLRYKLGTKQTSKPVPSRPVPKSGFVIIQAHPSHQAQLAKYAVVRLNPGQEEREKQNTTGAGPVKNRHALAPTAWKRPISLLQGQIGGLRGDPFNACPISTQGHVTSAFDYCMLERPRQLLEQRKY